MRISKRSCCGALVLVAMGCFLLFGSVYAALRSDALYAPSEGETRQSFLAKNGHDVHFSYEYEYAGRRIVVYALNFDRMPWWLKPFHFPSSMPHYLFDKKTDVLLDWSLDPGDTPSFCRRWCIPPKEKARVISRD